MIVNKIHKKLHNQIAGKTIIGYFNANKLYQMNVFGNSESVYFSTDSKNKYTGVNKTAAGSMKFDLIDGKINHIHFYEQPIATFYPIKYYKVGSLYLKLFSWKSSLRPFLKEFK
jgi:hypothetical protein